MTLYELDLLGLRHRRQQEREDRRSALSAWLLVNINRDSDKRPEPFSLEEVTAWLGYAGQYVKNESPQEARESAPPSAEELKQRIDAVHLLHRGLYGENGQQETDGES